MTNMIKASANAEERATLLKKMPFFTEISRPDSRLKSWTVAKSTKELQLTITLPPGAKIEQRTPLLNALSISNLTRLKDSLKISLKNTISSNKQLKEGTTQ